MPGSPSRLAAPSSPDWGRSSGSESGPVLSEEELGASAGSFVEVSSGPNPEHRSPSEEVDDERLRNVLTSRLGEHRDTSGHPGPAKWSSRDDQSTEAAAPLDAQGLAMNDLARELRLSGVPSVLVYPWQQGPLQWVFGHAPKRLKLEVPLPPEGAGNAGAFQAPEGVLSSKSKEFAKKRVWLASLIQTPDEARWEALRKFRTLVSLDMDATRLGRTLLGEAVLLRNDENLKKSFSHTFASKATGTLVKRASALWRFAAWCENNAVPSPLRASESIIYRYMLHLESTAKPTVGSGFLEAWNFMHAMVGLTDPGAYLTPSARIRGVSTGMLQLKAPLRQAHPLSVKMVKALEQVVLLAPYEHWKIVAGHLLLVLGSSARFGDTVRLRSLNLQREGGLALVEADSKHWKTMSKAKRDEFLPLCSFGQFFYPEEWAGAWFEARERMGLGLDPALPAWSESEGRFLDRPMSTGEAGLYLKEFLVGSGVSTSELIGCHSLKCTILSWVAKNDAMSLADRRLLGHHLDPSASSPVTYSRDELTRLMRRVFHVITLIRRGKFFPDKSRVWRLAHLLREDDPSFGLEGCELPDGPMMADSGEEGDDWGEGDMAVDSQVLRAQTQEGSISAVDAVLERACMMHRLSRVVHVLDDSQARFLCGRISSSNYSRLDPYVPVADMPMCSQCSKSY